VRVGNAAVNQVQLDVYGEILDALYLAHQHGFPTTERGVAIGQATLGHLAAIWRQPDEGIWEVRGPPQHFTHSKVMAWVAFDRAIKILESGKAEDPIAAWRRLRDEIHEDVCRNGFDPELGSFVQAYGSNRSMRACCLCRSSASCRRPTRVSSVLSTRSRNISSSTGL